MTENQIELLGFDFIKSYSHDEWWTRRFKKGLMQIEFTYKNIDNSLEMVALTIDEVVGMPITIEELKTLDLIINKTKK
jgi:hypothetical protein